MDPSCSYADTQPLSSFLNFQNPGRSMLGPVWRQYFYTAGDASGRPESDEHLRCASWPQCLVGPVIGNQVGGYYERLYW